MHKCIQDARQTQRVVSRGTKIVMEHDIEKSCLVGENCKNMQVMTLEERENGC